MLNGKEMFTNATTAGEVADYYKVGNCPTDIEIDRLAYNHGQVIGKTTDGRRIITFWVDTHKHLGLMDYEDVPLWEMKQHTEFIDYLAGG